MQAEVSSELLEELRRRAREQGRPERELLDEAVKSYLRRPGSLAELFEGVELCLRPLRGLAMQKLKTRHTDLRGVSGYMGEKRRKNVERFGYDVKHGAHAIRLLRMGIEFLRTGRFEVDRTSIDAVGAPLRGGGDRPGVLNAAGAS